MEYQEEDYLLLSGIQHFVFCRRQWALIHIEQQWEENVRTVEGNIMHKRAHDGPQIEQCGLSRKKKRGYHGAGDEGFLQRDGNQRRM